MSHIAALAEKFSELLLIFEHTTTIDPQSDADANVLKEGTQKHMQRFAFDMLGEIPRDEEEALQLLSVINHPLVADGIVPAAAKLASQQAIALVRSEAAIIKLMELRTETLLNLVERDLPEASLLQARIRNALEEMKRLKKDKS